MFSVVTIVKDDLNGFMRTRQSVEAQSFTEWIHIIVVASLDDSSFVAAQEIADSRTKILVQVGSGIYSAMNQGLALAREEYVVFLNAGDTFLDAMSLEYVSDALLESNPEWAAFGGYIRGQSGDLIRRPRPMSGVHEVAYGSAKFLHPSIYYKRTLLEELHGYNESFKIAGDLDLNIRSALCSSPLIVETPVSVFYADGISSKRIFLSIRESRRARRLNLDFTPKSSILDFVWFCYQNLRSGIAKLLTATED